MAYKYRGMLATARPHDLPGLLADEAELAARTERYNAESLKAWRALFKEHGVEWGKEDTEVGFLWRLLWRLAEAHVPWFKMRSRSGPRAVWDIMTKAMLRIAIDEYVATRKRHGKPASISHACTVLAKCEPWATKLREAKPRKAAKPAEALTDDELRADARAADARAAAALRGHYDTADKRWVEVVRHASAYRALLSKQGKVSLRDLTHTARNPTRATSRRNRS